MENRVGHMVNANWLMTNIHVFVKKSIFTVQQNKDASNLEEKKKHQNGHDGQNGVNAQQHVTKVSDYKNRAVLVSIRNLGLQCLVRRQTAEAHFYIDFIPNMTTFDNTCWSKMVNLTEILNFKSIIGFSGPNGVEKYSPQSSTA